VREGISVSTAEPFSTSEHVPHAIRVALGSVELTTLRESLETIKRVIASYTY
jgi:DNA-binding transcriptional MocR family regulator